MIKNFKYTLLLALFCSAQLPTQAGGFGDYFRQKKESVKQNWFLNYLGQRYFAIFVNIYPCNVIFATIIGLTAMTHKTKIDNEAIEKKYPHAFAYIKEQLKVAGVDPAHVEIADSHHAFAAKAAWKKLIVPLAAIEDQKPESQRSSNQAKVTTAHEISHLAGNAVAKITLAHALIIVGTELAAHRFPILRPFFPGTFIKTISSYALSNIYKHFEEHRADGESIKNFKKNPTALLDMSICWLNRHQQLAKSRISTQTTALGKQIYTNLWYKPIQNTCAYWASDVHGSDLSRANRLIKAAGLPCNQWLLARMLKRQLLDDFAKDPKEQAKEFDTAPIIDSLKKLNAVEMPYPFETYGQ